MNDFRTGLKYSLLIHASLLLLLVHPGCNGLGFGGGGQEKPKQEQGKGEQENKEKIAGKPEKLKDTTLQVEIVDAPALKKKSQPKHASAECPSGKSYGGLGIYEAQVGQEVIVSQAVKGYPGADIGLDFGDRILSPAPDAIKGEVGTEVNLIVRKASGETKTYTVMRDKICLESQP